METIATRIRYAIKEFELDERGIAQAAGIPYTTWRDIVNGVTSHPRKLREIARAMNVSLDWLAEGIGVPRPLTVEAVLSHDYVKEERASYGPRTCWTIPLLTWNQASMYLLEGEQPYRLNCPEIPTAIPVSANAFALKAVNSSMLPDFAPGSTIFVEPSIEAVTGDYVVVGNGKTDATFKVLERDAGEWLLRPLNPQDHTQKMPDDSRVIGVVIAMERRFR